MFTGDGPLNLPRVSAQISTSERRGNSNLRSAESTELPPVCSLLCNHHTDRPPSCRRRSSQHNTSQFLPL